jgi:hypothetical protein
MQIRKNSIKTRIKLKSIHHLQALLPAAVVLQSDSCLNINFYKTHVLIYYYHFMPGKK